MHFNVLRTRVLRVLLWSSQGKRRGGIAQEGRACDAQDPLSRKVPIFNNERPRTSQDSVVEVQFVGRCFAEKVEHAYYIIQTLR